MQCPICPTLLMRLEVGTLELDECPRCLGMWFDKGELQQLVGAALEATRNLQQRFLPPTGEEKVPARAACPRCVIGRLAERHEGGHALAGCGHCGGAWVPGTLLSYILSVEDVPEDLAELEALSDAPSPIEPGGTGPVPAVTMPAAAPASDAPAAGDSAAVPMPIEVVPFESASQPEPEPASARPQVTPPPLPAPMRRAAPLQPVQGACPACGKGFGVTSHEGQSFHRCEGCEGLFFPRGGLPAFLSRKPKTYVPPASLTAPEPEGTPPCPGCGEHLNPMRWQNRPVRVMACEGCWSTFASAEGVRRFVHPEWYMEEDVQSGPGLALWRAFDTFTDWLGRPRTHSAFRFIRGGRY